MNKEVIASNKKPQVNISRIKEFKRLLQDKKIELKLNAGTASIEFQN